MGLNTAILKIHAIQILNHLKISVCVGGVIFCEIELDRRYAGVFSNFDERKTSNTDNDTQYALFDELVVEISLLLIRPILSYKTPILLIEA